MAILDIFKNKEEETKATSKIKKPVKKAVKKVSVASVRQSSESEGDKKNVTASVKATAGQSKFSYEAIKQPHISEKATYLAESNQYTFKVAPNYNKHEIKNAVEGVYGVNVLSVNIIKIPAKKRRLGKTQGFRKAFKKAIVTIKEGQKIEIL